VNTPPLKHPIDIVRTLEVGRILFNPTLLAVSFACLAAFGFVAVPLTFDATIVRNEQIFATAAFTFYDKTHDPAPLGQSSSIRYKAERKRYEKQEEN
jgi:hypothetical protein